MLRKVPDLARALPRGRCRALGEAGPSAHPVRRGQRVLLAPLPVDDPRRFVLGTILRHGGARLAQYPLSPGAYRITLVHRVPIILVEAIILIVPTVRGPSA